MFDQEGELCLERGKREREELLLLLLLVALRVALLVALLVLLFLVVSSFLLFSHLHSFSLSPFLPLSSSSPNTGTSRCAMHSTSTQY